MLKVFVVVLCFVINFWTVFWFGSIPCVICIFGQMCSVVWFLYTILCIWTLLGYPFCQHFSFHGSLRFLFFSIPNFAENLWKIHETCVLQRNSHSGGQVSSFWVTFSDFWTISENIWEARGGLGGGRFQRKMHYKVSGAKWVNSSFAEALAQGACYNLEIVRNSTKNYAIGWNIF